MDSLKELGISTFGKRYKIMQAIADLKAEKREVGFGQYSAAVISLLILLIDSRNPAHTMDHGIFRVQRRLLL